MREQVLSYGRFKSTWGNIGEASAFAMAIENKNHKFDGKSKSYDLKNKKSIREGLGLNNKRVE
ncbi:hypothetical protein HPP92_005675 [Vanilla planifolia]|uniref:Uncharacterized protein n=1 Tax=Vanilla planifolia TaxID=51239 RepID=A0A835VFM8_VANPL|nr:hypothetical protein HPP92_005675 [Vanilla planifolia]